jgi:hypothetical protein
MKASWIFLRLMGNFLKIYIGCFLFGLDSGVSWEAGLALRGSRTAAAPSPQVVEAPPSPRFLLK